MLLDWNGHLNYEYCGSNFVILYVYKYLVKGNKKVIIDINNFEDLKDKINQSTRGRIISTMDTMWREFGNQTYPSTYLAVCYTTTTTTTNNNNINNNNNNNNNL